MNAYLKNVSVAFVIMFLCFSSASDFVFAKSSTQLCSTAHLVSQEEVVAQRNIASLITCYSSVAGYTSYDWHGSQTTADHIYSAAFGVGDYYSITFYIGDGNAENVWHDVIWYEKQWFISDDSGNKVYDSSIFPYSRFQSVRFAFLWSCFQGETVGGTHWSSKPFGMPYAWLHTELLSNDGYVNPDGRGQVFLGFDNMVPYLTDNYFSENEAYLPHAGNDFVSNFYLASLYYGFYNSINGALDYASRLVWGVPNFDCSILHDGYNFTYLDLETGAIRTAFGKMPVYGDGSMHISNYGGGGTGCPLLFVYDGEKYSYEGLLDIHNPNGIDVVRRHPLTATLESVNNAYLLRLVEHPLTHSYIDQVKLLAVLEDGRIMQLPLISAIHDEHGNVLRELLRSDDVRTDTSANQAINLAFRAVSPHTRVVSFIFQIEGNNPASKK